MDPKPLTTAEWGDVGTALKMMWLAFGAALIAGSTLLTAHAVIPSAVATNTISTRWLKWRPAFYVVGLVAVAAILVFIVLAALQLDWIDRVYGRFWQ